MNHNFQIVPIASLEDNYVWVIHDKVSNHCVVVDPGEASPVLAYLKKHCARLTAILVTHHHQDHIGGISMLCQHFTDVRVYGPFIKSLSSHITVLKEGDALPLLNHELMISVHAVPGHTTEHLAYYLPQKGVPSVFTGDTLFSGGCGRLLGGTATQLYESLHKLKQLPLKTRVYAGHEYTVANLAFAFWLEPDNKAVCNRLKEAKQNRIDQIPTLPSTIQIEHQINPFLRCDESIFSASMQKRFNLPTLLSAVELFSYLRTLKDHWNIPTV